MELFNASYEITEGNDINQELELVLSCLTDTEEALIRIKYGIEDGLKRNIKEVADRLCISQELAEETEKRALSKLNSPRKRKVFEKYINSTESVRKM